MKKHFTLLFVALVFTFTRFMAQTYIPVATTGYTLDGVAENTTAISTTGGAMDASDFNLYSQYYGTLYGPTAVGLPNNGLIVNGQRTYQLQSYTGPNVLFIQPSLKDSLAFVTPQAFPVISLLSFATQGNAVLNIKIRFTDNTTQVLTGISLADWFTANPSVYNGFDRVLRSTGIPAYVGSAGNPRMFGTDLNILCANQGKLIRRVVIENQSTAYVCVMAIAGNVPGYSVNGNTSICTSGTSTLNATGFATYTWQPVGAFAGSNAATINVSPSSTTSYTLQGTDINGCPGYTTVTVNVSGAPPVLSLAGSSQSVCLGTAATLTASGAINYTWTNGVTNGVAFNPTITTTYTVTGENGCGTTTGVNTVSVGPIPVALSSNTTIVCSNNPVTLSVSAVANSFTWQPVNSIGAGTTLIVSPSVTTIYTVTAASGACRGTNTISIQTNTLPVINAQAIGSSSICPGASATLSASGGINYSWTPGNQNTNTISVSPTVTTTYVVGGDNSFGCLSGTFITVVVNTHPNVTVTANSSSVCAGSSVTLTANGANTYAWVNGSATNTNVVSPTQSSIYTVTGTFSGSGCTDTRTISIFAFAPSLNISGNTTVCAGNSTSLTATGANNYVWTPGGLPFSLVTVFPLSTTIYTVNATAISGVLTCPISGTIEVTVNAVPTLSTVSTKTAICAKETNTLTASGAATYTWTSSTKTVVAASVTVTSNSATQIIYTVTAASAEGCTVSATMPVIFKTCTGIEELEGNSKTLMIYPNPSNGEFTVKSAIDLKLKLVNQLGQLIQEVRLDEKNDRKYTLVNIPEGIYFIVGDQLNAKIVVGK